MTFSDIRPVIHLSSAKGYRARAEFGWNSGLYTMMADGKKIFMDRSSIPHSSIQEMMPKLLASLNNSEVLTKKLFQINFRTSGTIVLVTLIYHCPLQEDWNQEIIKINNTFKNISIIGRSKKQKISIGEENIMLTFNHGESNFKILQNDTGFFQPNFYLYPMMISFIIKHLKKSEDLLELYCGCGGFTLPLASKFKKVFATENNRHSIRLLKESIKLNNLSNIETVRLSDNETASALANKRTFRRLENINMQSYQFSHILVDPPRAGLSDETINLSNQFKNIIYISCNPETFMRDMVKLDRKIESIGIFDQFANTQHLEVVALIK
jgi:tRNA (uracil-5-)-methyltransferase